MRQWKKKWLNYNVQMDDVEAYWQVWIGIDLRYMMV